MIQVTWPTLRFVHDPHVLWPPAFDTCFSYLPPRWQPLLVVYGPARNAEKYVNLVAALQNTPWLTSGALTSCNLVKIFVASTIPCSMVRIHIFSYNPMTSNILKGHHVARMESSSHSEPCQLPQFRSPRMIGPHFPRMQGSSSPKYYTVVHHSQKTLLTNFSELSGPLTPVSS